MRYGHARLLCALAGAIASALAARPGVVPAQAVLGIGDDATVVSRGVVRLWVAAALTSWGSRYASGSSAATSGGVEPLGAALSRDTLGVQQFESLAPIQTALRQLTGIPNFAVTLGRSVVRVDASVREFPVTAEVGLTPRFSVGLTVPIVRTRTDVVLNVNPAGREGNLGFNPALTLPAARGTNTQLVVELLSAAQSFETALGGAGYCATAAGQADPRCGVVTESRRFAGTLAAIYGTASISGIADTTGLAFVPVTGTAAQTAIAARIQTFKNAFGAFGAGITTLAPFAASTPLGVDSLQRVLTDPAFGIAADPLQTVEHTGIGDIELSGKLQWLDRLGDARRDYPPSGLHVRSAVTGILRLGTGQRQPATSLLDVGSPSGYSAVELRSQNDLVFGTRLWASIVGRYTWPIADTRTMRVAPPDLAFAPAYTQQRVGRTLGADYGVELTPRYVLNSYFALSAQYAFRHKASDHYAGLFHTVNTLGQAVVLDASVLDVATAQTEHRLYAGVTYSTLAAVRRGTSGLPIEIFFQHGQSVAGSGGRTPRLSEDAIQVRVYTRIFGGT